MRRKLSPDEKDKLRAERLALEREAFPDFDVDVIVEDFTWANGEPVVRVIRRDPGQKQN
jgi:hypothetical protein